VGTASSEQTCSKIDLKPYLNGIKPRHQGRSNFCFAVVTADLLTAELQAPVSAVDVAIQSLRGNPTVMNGSSVKEAVRALKSQGACVSGQEDDPKKFDQLMADLSSIKDHEMCERRVGLQGIKVRTLNGSDYAILTNSHHRRQQLLMEQVDSLLEREKLVGVSYYADECVFCTPGFHVVSLVGRYFDKTSQKCVYELRNSYGEYDERPNYSGVFAREGYIHMPREVALQKLLRISWVERAP
jgi:hypothetical protein